MNTYEAPGTTAGGDLMLAKSAPRRSRRIAATGALAVLLTAGAAGCSSSAEDTATAPTPTPTATVSAEAPAATSEPVNKGTSTLRLGAWTSKPATSLPGTLVFMTSVDAQRMQVNVLADGVLRTATLEGPMAAKYDCSSESITTSPDGTSVAWVEGDASADAGTAVVVASLAGGTPRVVAGAAKCSGGPNPRWLPDSRRLEITPATGTPGLLDVQTEAFTPTDDSWGNYRAWSPGGGEFTAYSSDNKIVVATADGKVLRQVPYSLASKNIPVGFAIHSVSPDGRRVAVGPRNTDPQTVRQALWIVDTVTGEEVAPPLKGAGALQYVAGGGMLVVSGKAGASTLHLFDASGKQLASVPFPAGAIVGSYLP